MCFLWGTDWVFIPHKTAFFIVTAMITSSLTQKNLLPLPAISPSSSVVPPVKFSLYQLSHPSFSYVKGNVKFHV
jgi:hypothetical protein